MDGLGRAACCVASVQASLIYSFTPVSSPDGSQTRRRNWIGGLPQQGYGVLVKYAYCVCKDTDSSVSSPYSRTAPRLSLSPLHLYLCLCILHGTVRSINTSYALLCEHCAQHRRRRLSLSSATYHRHRQLECPAVIGLQLPSPPPLPLLLCDQGTNPQRRPQPRPCPAQPSLAQPAQHSIAQRPSAHSHTLLWLCWRAATAFALLCCAANFSSFCKARCFSCSHFLLLRPSPNPNLLSISPRNQNATQLELPNALSFFLPQPLRTTTTSDDSNAGRIRIFPFARLLRPSLVALSFHLHRHLCSRLCSRLLFLFFGPSASTPASLFLSRRLLPISCSISIIQIV